MDKNKVAQLKFSNGCNCAQAVLVALAPKSINDDNLLLIASAFGGGVAQQGKTCGVVTGALMALGLHKGYTESNLDDKAEFYVKAQRFIEEFKQKNGSDQCKKLIGYDISIASEKEKAREQEVFKNECPKFLDSAIEIMEKII
ncbi:C_GCAxxG_C_C family protein [Labilibacter sediminis]|nr:C_GCAxxG_C_C family protein [Labilibacter sediminis]